MKHPEHLLLIHAYLPRIVEAGVVGVVLWRADGRIEEANDRFLELTGYSREDLAGGRLSWKTLVATRGEARPSIEAPKAGEIVRGEVKECLRKDGGCMFLRLHSTPCGDSGHLISVAIDVTEQKNAEAEAENAVRARDDILAIVSHDLRNPLGTIAMTATLLDAPAPESTRKAQLDIIHRAVSRMRRLIEDLLDVTQVTSGRLRIATAPLEIASVCDEARQAFAPLMAAKSQQLECTLPPEPLIVEADRDRIFQVLSNLLGNAHKFTPEGGHVRLLVESAEGFARFMVADSGPGLSSEDLPHVFDRFWQARRVRRGGVGLGLPITKGIVDAHGGRIWAESTAGVGTRFFFTIPLAAT